jgi:hypothetical protein
MSEAVQIEMLHDIMLVLCGLVTAASLVGVAWFGAQRVLEKTAEIHTLVNDKSDKQNAMIASLTNEVARLNNAASKRDGVDLGVVQEKARNADSQ